MNRKELVQKMLETYGDAKYTTCKEGMDAALSVAIEELRERVSERINRYQDIQSWHEKESRNGLVCEIRDAADEEFAKLERVKTPREQIEAVIDKHRAQINNGRTPMDDMVIDLVRLIAKLTAELPKNQ